MSQSGVSEIKKIKGGEETQLLIGVNPYAIANGLTCYALSVRVTGTIIAAITAVDNNGNAFVYNPSWLGVALQQGDYFVSLYRITNITLTAATDSVALHCDSGI